MLRVCYVCVTCVLRVCYVLLRVGKSFGAFVLVPCDFITNFFSSKFLERWRHRSETMFHEAENVTLRYYLSFYRVLKKVLEHKSKCNPC